MISNRRMRTAKALVAMALDRGDKPEGIIARQKLLALINRNPELISYPPIVALAQSDLGFVLPATARATTQRPSRPHITMQDIYAMRKAGIDTSGSWTGRNLNEAIAMAAADLIRRREGAAMRVTIENANGSEVDITDSAKLQ